MTEQFRFGFDPEAAKEARDDALERMEKNSGSWVSRAVEKIREFPCDEAIGEDLRLFVVQKIGPPHHNNAMGAVVRNAIRQGILIHTGTVKAMKTKKSHARRSFVYRINRAKNTAVEFPVS